MIPDYSPRQYYTTANRKRQIVNAMLETLYELHEEMIEQALQASDWNEAKEVIKYIQEK